MLICLGLLGCGDENAAPSVATYEAKGKVLLADGRPLTTGQIILVPRESSGVAASGSIGPDGTFTLTTKSPGDGAAAGEYKVRIDLDYRTAPAVKRAGKAVPPFPEKFSDEDNSGLTLTVKPEPNDLGPITLK